MFENFPFIGLIETVPAYNSLAIFFDALIVKNNQSVDITAFEAVKLFAEKRINEIETTLLLPGKTVHIPVYYNGEDLQEVASQHQLSEQEVISIHTSQTYRVFMIGFLPGFAYMGSLDERIATPRLPSPRANVKAGSVGIAGFQTGIYSIPSPGGWQIIGQTPIKIFDKTKTNPCLLKAGDVVEFKSITKSEFDKTNEY